MARPRSDISPRIVQAARARFLAEGVDGASLRQIAAEAGTSIGMIYYYFPTKDDLFLAVVEETYARVLHDVEAVLARPEVDVRARLRGAFERLGAASPEEAEVMRLIAREALVSSQRLDRIIDRFRRGHIPLVLGTIGDGYARGEIDPGLPLPLALACTVGIGVVPQILRRLAGDRVPALAGLPTGEAFADVLVELLFRAIGPRPGGEPSGGPPPAPTAPG